MHQHPSRAASGPQRAREHVSQGFDTGVDPGLEKSRQEWLTAANLARHFEVARDTLLMSGIFELNPDFDPSVDYWVEIIVKVGMEHYLRTCAAGTAHLPGLRILRQRAAPSKRSV